jgi:hypothetical protein
LRLLAAIAFLGCGGGGPGGPSDADSDTDTDTGTGPDLPPWDPGLPGSDRIAPVRGRRTARGIIHCHSVYSHDACDGDNTIDGEPNEPCLDRFRRAICDTRQDFVMLTEHDAEMADFPFEDMFLARGDDEPILEGAVQVASRVRCDEGPGTLLFPGAENEIMPVMLREHPPGDVDARHAAYDTEDPAVARQFRDQGGLVLVPHTEHWSIDALRSFGPDGIEIYNLHANIDPDIRRDWLGLPAFGAIGAAVEYSLADPAPGPDLVFLAFFEESPTDLDRWDALLQDGPMPGIVGTDAHENAIPGELADGERGDSYRRMMRWFGNYLRVDTMDPAGIKDALENGRTYAAFHAFGVPEGFDFRVETAAETFEMGETHDWEAGATAHLTIPAVMDLDPALPRPEVRATILRVAEGERETVAEGDLDLEVEIAGPGAYRAEIRMVPRHVEPYLLAYDPKLIREVIWVYSGAIRLE